MAQLPTLRRVRPPVVWSAQLVVNVQSGNMVGGHQRVKILGDAPIRVLKRYPKPTKQGTIAEGFAMYNGERFVYRVESCVVCQESENRVSNKLPPRLNDACVVMPTGFCNP